MLSAYSQAQMLGFEGTLDEFIELISGKDGADGKDGVNGTDGKDGIDGADGKDGADGLTPYIKDGYWWIGETNTGVKAEAVDGTNGTDGKDGADGKDGIDGADGKSAYELYKERFGYEGTEEQWISDLINGKLVTDYHEHSFGEWVDYGGTVNRLLYRICSTCNCIEWKNGGCVTCDFTTVTTAPTCQAGGYDTNTCTVCGKVEITNETAIVDHEWQNDYSYDNSFHWYKCEHCDATKDNAEHATDDSGYCTVCDNPIGASVGVMYEISLDGTYAEVVGYTGTATKIVLADTYEGLPVKTICKEAFKNSAITSVVIPDSVTSIGESAFFDCDSLTSVVIGDSVTSIGSYAFSGCSSLTSVVIGDSVTTIGDYAFQNCSKLTSVTINGTPNIGNGAFSSCDSALYTTYEFGKYVGDETNPYAVLIEVSNKNLRTYDINENTKVIAYGVFSYCERLTEIVIPESVCAISSHAFYNCDSLTSVVIGDSVTTIGNYAFYNCDSLTSVVIPDSITTIGLYAFQNCSSLTSIEYRGTEEQWNAITKGYNWNYGTGNYTITFNYDGE